MGVVLREAWSVGALLCLYGWVGVRQGIVNVVHRGAIRGVVGKFVTGRIAISPRAVAERAGLIGSLGTSSVSVIGIIATMRSGFGVAFPSSAGVGCSNCALRFLISNIVGTLERGSPEVAIPHIHEGIGGRNERR